MRCQVCGFDIVGGKGDWWHTTQGGGYGEMQGPDGHLAFPAEEQYNRDFPPPLSLEEVITALLDTTVNHYGAEPVHTEVKRWYFKRMNERLVSDRVARKQQEKTGD